MKRTVIIALAALAAIACEKGEKQPARPEVTGKVETYVYAQTVKPSPKYTVTINGEQQLVYTTPEPHVCVFGCDGTVEVRISSPAVNISSADVRPFSKKPWNKLENGELVLYMNPKDRYVVELNGSLENPLFIFANPLSSEIEPKGSNVLRFEAGKVHTAGIITPAEGQAVYIEGGAVVIGNIDRTSSSNIEICGGGILHDSAENDKAVGNKTSIRLQEVNGVKLHDLTVLNSTSWTTLMVNCSNVEADNYKAIGYASTITETGNENDSFDILGGHDISIRHCFSYCHDDTFCIKSQKFSYKGEVSNVSYEDCIAWNTKSGNSFEIGYELNYPVHDISYRDIYSIHASNGHTSALRRGAVCIHNAGCGTVSHVRYENVYVEDPHEFGIYMMVAKSNYNIGDGVEWSPGKIEDVVMKNVYMLNWPSLKNYIQAYNSTDHGIEVTFENIVIEGHKVTGKEDGKFSLYNCTPTFK